MRTEADRDMVVDRRHRRDLRAVAPIRSQVRRVPDGVGRFFQVLHLVAMLVALVATVLVAALVAVMVSR